MAIPQNLIDTCTSIEAPEGADAISLVSQGFHVDPSVIDNAALEVFMATVAQAYCDLGCARSDVHLAIDVKDQATTPLRTGDDFDPIGGAPEGGA